MSDEQEKMPLYQHLEELAQGSSSAFWLLELASLFPIYLPEKF